MYDLRGSKLRIRKGNYMGGKVKLSNVKNVHTLPLIFQGGSEV